MLSLNRAKKVVMTVAASVAMMLTAARAEDASKPNLALEVNSAVCLVDAGKIVKGSDTFTSTDDSPSDLFPSAREKAAFDANPEQFAPVLNGVCVVKGDVRRWQATPSIR